MKVLIKQNPTMLFQSGEGVLRENAMILHSMIDMNNTIKALKENGIDVFKQDIKNLSS